MPRSILHVGMCFFDTVLIMHKPTNELAFFVCFFGSRDMTDTTIRKNTKAAIICLKKEKEKMASFPFVCICGSNTRLKFQIETRKIERGIAVITLILIKCIGIVLRSHPLMGDELGSAVDIDYLLVSSGLSTPIFTLIGNDDFWSCNTDLRPKMSPKIGNFEFSWIPKQFGPAYALLCHGQCFQFSSPSLQWLTSCD